MLKNTKVSSQYCVIVGELYHFYGMVREISVARVMKSSLFQLNMFKAHILIKGYLKLICFNRFEYERLLTRMFQIYRRSIGDLNFLVVRNFACIYGYLSK